MQCALEHCTNVQYISAMDHPSFLPTTWLHRVATRLQAQWPTVDPQQLDDVALDLWRDERLRAMQPEEAAVAWLRPVLPE